ncbi:MAG: hypothetical protein JWP38_1114 [Herbaspirillum sp.]|nr:hypothetical protein [Herbaspirillum sp.]
MNKSSSFSGTASGIEQCRQYAALIAFNRAPSRYLHPSWRTAFADASLADFLFDGRYAHALLSAHILRTSGLTDIPDQLANHSAVRIGMHLNMNQMQELASRIALVLIGQPIRSAISKAAIAAWTAAIGESLYRFTCKHAPLLGGSRFTALPEWQFPPISPHTKAEQIDAIGFRFLNAACEVLDISVGQRIRFKLPRDIAQQIHPTINPDHTQEVWPWINRVWSSMPTPISPSIIPVEAAYK